jgi:Fe-S cluster biogenesis protein NfuA
VTTDESVERALAVIRPGFTEDGFDLRLGQIDERGSVEVILEALPGACFECLVPDAMMVQILEKAIQSEAPELGSVVLTKTGFETAGEH